MTATRNAGFVMRKYVGPRVDEVPEGGRFIGDFGGRQIGILNVDGKFYAFLHRCPHLSGPLCEGSVLGLVYSPGPGDIRFDAKRKMLTCPWHGWEFDLETGQSYWNPNGLRARSMPVEVQHGAQVAAELADGTAIQLFKGPYVAQTYPVTVESDYLVVTIRERAEAAVNGAAGGTASDHPAATAPSAATSQEGKA
jgi:nitrite reductase/ring-hydroxylating ferredoxin subunit